MQRTKTKRRRPRPWSKDEVNLIKRLFPQGRAREIAKRTGRSLMAVRRKAYYVGIRTREDRLWSANEVRLLKKLYHNENAQSIADKLGRSYMAVKGKADRLGLTEELRVKLGLRKRYRYDDCHRVVNGVKEKLCGKCRKWKAESQFCKNRRPKDGLEWRCKECQNKHSRKRYDQIRKTGRRNLRFEDRHRVVKGVKQKLCRNCERWINETGFHKRRSEKDGLAGRCKKCSCKPTDKSRKK